LGGEVVGAPAGAVEAVIQAQLEAVGEARPWCSARALAQAVADVAVPSAIFEA
jgi:hypothetical protein